MSSMLLLRTHMKSPAECTNLGDVRAEIDAIDQQIIALLGTRFAYVKAAAQFKTSADSVRAPERFAAMLSQRRAWAEEQHLSPDVIEQIYRTLVQYFIDEELRQWQGSA